MSSPLSWKFEWITDWDTIYSDSFQQLWLDFAEQADEAHVFFHPALGMAWLDAYRPIRHLEPWFCIATLGDMRIFFPLVLWHRNWKNAFQRLLVPVGFSDFDYHDPLVLGSRQHVDERSFYNALLVEIRGSIRYDTLKFNGTAHAMGSIFEVAGTSKCPYIDINRYECYESYVQSLSKNTQRNITKSENRTKNDLEGLTIIDISNNDIGINIEELSNMLRHHCLQWPLFYKAENFHEMLIRNSHKAGILEFQLMKAHEEVMAWLVMFKYKDVKYLYMTAIGNAYRMYSPGAINLLHAVRTAFDQQISKVDFLRGEEAYKFNYAKEYKTIHNYSHSASQPGSLFRNKLVRIVTHIR